MLFVWIIPNTLKKQHIYKPYNSYKDNKMTDTTTIAIFKTDFKDLDKMMDRGERFRDKIHELVIEEKKRLKK